MEIGGTFILDHVSEIMADTIYYSAECNYYLFYFFKVMDHFNNVINTSF